MEALNKRPVDTGLVISVEELKQNYLFGVDLTDDNGNQQPDSLMEFYIRAAQDWLKVELGGAIEFCEREFTEQQDYRLTDYIQYAFFKLQHGPVQSVEEVAVQFPLSTNVLKFDPSWYRPEFSSRILNLFPAQGTFSSIILSQGGSFIPMLYSGIEHVPMIWRIKYRAGFKPGEIPANIKMIVGLKAAMGPLNIAGDLIAGAGIANKSIGLDGLSQSIGTTASATNAGYGARIIQYEKQIKNELANLKAYWVGINMVVA